MIERLDRKALSVLSRVSLSLGLLVPLFAAACGPSQAANSVGPGENGTPSLAVRATSTSAVRNEGTSPATRTPEPTATLTPEPSAAVTVEPVQPTLIPGAETAPDFHLPDLDGEGWTLSEFRGQPVMLFVWATW